MAPDLRTQPGPHVFVADLEVPRLDADDHHHLAKSLRLRPGAPITVSDGAGRWRNARFGDEVEPAGPIHEVAAPRYEVGLGVALTKAAKPEFAIQKATELGIDRIVVFGADHSVVRWDEAKRERNAARLARVAREAAMQSRRVTVPTVEIVGGLEDLMNIDGVVRADFGGGSIEPGHRFVLVGPEGGWSDDERRRVPDAVDLGPTVLRAETASVIASAYLVGSRGQK